MVPVRALLSILKVRYSIMVDDKFARQTALVEELVGKRGLPHRETCCLNVEQHRPPA